MRKSRTRAKNRLRKRRKTRRGGTYESFTSTDLKKAAEQRQRDTAVEIPSYETFSKSMLAKAQDERQELDDYHKQTECSRIDEEIGGHEREIASHKQEIYRLKIEKRGLRCSR